MRQLPVWHQPSCTRILLQVRGCQELLLQASTVSHLNGICWARGRDHGCSRSYLYRIIYLVALALYLTFHMDIHAPSRTHRPAGMPLATIYRNSLQRQYGAWAACPRGA
jgi:hypothetical protein